MKGDPRGFKYVLEPVQARRAWALEAALARLAQLAARQRACEGEARLLAAACEVSARQVASAWSRHRDPKAHALVLCYLLELQHRQDRLAGELRGLALQVARARRECERRQLEAQALAEHKAGCLREHDMQQQRIAAAHADGEWLARRSLGQGASA